ncbi:MAG: transglycosylase domain-containing protein [Bacteroidota bacterium]
MTTHSKSSFLKRLEPYLAPAKARWAAFSSQMPRLARAVKIIGGGAAVGLFSLLLFFQLIRFGAFGHLPTAEELKDIQNHAASEVYSADGVLLGKYFVENRTPVGVDEVSTDIVNALIATEDARFFDHHGVDMRASMRVLFKTILMNDESSGGGSTLSQQLAKNLFQRKRYRLLSIPINKIREMYVARRLERVYTKEELLNLYLNTVPFGGKIYGVEVAARQFFSTTAKEVKTEEAAVLVGMLKANTYYNPQRNPKNATRRRNTVLSQMHKYGYLSKAVCDSLKALPLEVKYQRESNNEGLATFFREHLRQELAEEVEKYEKSDGTPYNLYTDGLRIYTTIHSDMQRYAEEAVSTHMSQLQKSFDKHWKGRKPWGNESVLGVEIQRSNRYKSMKANGATEEEIEKAFNTPMNMTIFTYKGDEQKTMTPLDSIKYYYALLNAGFLVTDPSTGAIRAWVGGIDHKYFKYDHIKSRRQVGSTFKPIVYASAIRSGFQPCDYYYNRLVTYTEYEDWRPENADGEYGGLYSMQGALTKSINSVAVDLIIRNSVDSVRTLAAEMGIRNNIPKAPAIALGAVDASLLEMTQVYATFANRGVRPEIQYLSRIENSRGEIIAEFGHDPSTFEEVMTADEADIMTKMMEAVVDSGTARRLRYRYGLKGALAGKTGTTQSHTDGWFMGYTPRLVGGVWVGGESPRVRFRSLSLGQGANTALPIWGHFLKKLYADPAFRKWKAEGFAPTSYEVADALDCAPFMEELPLLAADTIQTLEDSFDRKLNGLFDVFRKNKKVQPRQPVNTSPRVISDQERLQERARIQKKNEKTKKKRERKKKRKKFWGKIFKKD